MDSIGSMALVAAQAHPLNNGVKRLRDRILWTVEGVKGFGILNTLFVAVAKALWKANADPLPVGLFSEKSN